MDESFLELLVSSSKTATDDEIRRVFDSYERELTKRGIKVTGPKRVSKPGHNLTIGTNYGHPVTTRPTSSWRVAQEQKRLFEEREALAELRNEPFKRGQRPEVPADVAFVGSPVEVDYSHLDRAPDGTLRWGSSWAGPTGPEQTTWQIRVLENGRESKEHSLFIARLTSSHRIDAEYLVGIDLDDDDF